MRKPELQHESSACRKCRGARFVLVSNKGKRAQKVPCPNCGGSGARCVATK